VCSLVAVQFIRTPAAQPTEAIIRG
jgi:hypothetical protein